MNDAIRPDAGATPAASDGSTVFDLETELGRSYAAVDWSATALGPIETWSGSLKSTVRLMMASRFAMWMCWGPDLTFFCNDDYRRDTLGAKYPWALGRPTSEVWAEVWTDILPRVEAVLGSGESTWDEGLLLFLERSGYTEETYHTFSYSPLFDDDGSIVGLFCVVSEDTGRVVSQRRITTLRDLGADLARASSEHEVYAATERQLASDPFDIPFAAGYLLDGTTARRAWSVGIDPDHSAVPAEIDLEDPTAAWVADHPADGANHRIELAGRFANLPTGARDEPPLEVMISPLLQAGSSTPYGFLIAALNRYRPLDADYLGFLDLLSGQLAAAINRARAFDAERTRAEQMAELDRAKTTFFTNVSHELRTPLTLLLGPAEDALADATLDVTQRERIEVMHRNAERLLKLVNTLLDFSRLESGRTQALFEPVDLARYTAELASMFESALSRAGLRLEVDADPLAGEFHVDREMWAKIVLNLLSNALKATFEGGVRVRFATAADGSAQLAVTDTGIGIPAQEQDRLFERFHRVSGAALRSHEGSGIGLALVAELVHLHGGEVRVESQVGTGTTFTVTVPAGSAHLPAAQVAVAASTDVHATEYGAGYLAEALRWSGAETASDLQSPATQADSTADGLPRVLVADDNADMRDYIAGLLGDAYAVTSVPDGASALEAALAAPPDLVLTDVMMPNLDGFGLLAALRADPSTMHVPVVMLSARSGEEAAIEGLEAGADDYLVKPFSARELLARVRANLELDRVRRLVDELERRQGMLARAERLAAVGSWEYDVVHDWVSGSDEFFRLVGSTPAALERDGFAAALSLVHPEDVEPTGAAFRHSIETGEPLDVEYRVVPPDTAPRRVWVSGVLDRAPDGTPTRLWGSIQDITQQRQAEQAVINEAAAREAQAREHAIAVELQRSLLPVRSFDADHLDVATYYRAGVEGTEVGGDWYDVIELDAGRTALVLGDVMGRGVQAAAVMGQLRATVRAYARMDVAPDLLLHMLDAAVREISEDTIVTCVYAVYDPTDRSLIYANAGHLPPLLTAPGEPVRRLTGGGPPLGTGRAWTKPEVLTLPPGAMLTLYTDGLVEERTTDLDVGIDALAALLDEFATRTGAAATPIEALPDHLVAQLRPEGPEDDIAVLVARVSDRSADDRFVSRMFPSDTDIARSAREFAIENLMDWRVAEDLIDDVELVVSELVTNALRHGRPPVQMRLRRSIDRLFIDVHDSAAAPPQMRHAGPHDDGGRGLLIVSTLTQRWGTRHTENGKSVWCMVRLR